MRGAIASLTAAGYTARLTEREQRMDTKEIYMTPVGEANLRSELQHLTEVRRPELAIKAEKCRGAGRPQENAD